MEFIEIHQVLGDLKKDSNQFLIDVKKVDSDPKKIEQINSHPDIKASFVQVQGPYDSGYYRVHPSDWTYHWKEAEAAYGFAPREAVGEKPSDHVLYVKNTPSDMKRFKDRFNKLAKDMKHTVPYIKDMIGKIDVLVIGADKLNADDRDALINL